MSDADDELDERRLQVVAEQAGGLRWQIALTGAVVVALVWSAVPALWSLTWLALVLGAREWRAAALRRLVDERQRPIAQRLRATTRLNLLIGAANGSAALFMPRLEPTLDAVLTMILVSWGAGAVSTSSTVMPAFLAYAALVFLPTAALWLAQGGWLGVGIAALVLMFFGVQIRFARRNLETFEQSFRIRLENVQLARQLQAEQAALAAARDAAVKANHEKSHFLAAASHDLRQPLQAVLLNSGALAQRAADADARAIAADIAACVEHLRSMLDGLLDVSKLDAGAVVPQPRGVELARLLDGIAQNARPAARERGVEIEVDAPAALQVRSDPALLRRLIANLLDNAVKFSPRGARVRLAADAADGRATIRVADQGPGIAAADHQRIFEDLVQLPGAPRGHGLGLGIVRRLAELLGITLALDSAPGRGTVFELGLPLDAAADAPAGAPAPDDLARLAGKRVLVLDDDPMVRGATLHALGALGCAVEAAADIAAAEARLRDAPVPDALVVDFRLGREGEGDDGFAALARLRALRPGLAAVMVSAHADDALAARAREHGIALLRKPVDAATLARALAAATSI